MKVSLKVSLEDWLNEGRLKAHRTSKNELSEFLALFKRDMADAQSDTISVDRKFATAYNAALTLSVAALAASGYRPAGEGHHYWAIQSLAFTLQLDAETIEKFNKFRRKRNITDYERSGRVSEKEVSEMLELARNLQIALEAWLKNNHPELLQE
jgi:hypothetical protein